MSVSILYSSARRLRMLAIFVGLAVTCAQPVSAQMIYPVESQRDQAKGSDKAAAELDRLSRIGRGHYVPQRIKRLDEKHINKFETCFEECAPGRNSGANEWSAFGAIGNMDFNAMGRELWVRYPAFELKFRMQDGATIVEPGQLESFRLGLVHGHLPAIWGGWQHAGLLYKVSVMTVPSPECGNFDLYKLEIQNPTAGPLPSKLLVDVDGPPDMKLADGVLRGLGENAFLIVDPPARSKLESRDAGWCDKRAKAVCEVWSENPGPAINSSRLGRDGVPVVYRLRAEPGKKYAVRLAAPARNLGAYYGDPPRRPGELIFEYRVEGCEPKTIDAAEWIAKHGEIIRMQFDGTHDTDGDGAIEVRVSTAPSSKARLAWLGAIWLFPEGTKADEPETVAGGKLNPKCLHFVDVGSTPEQACMNQHHDKTDVSYNWMRLEYGDTIAAGETKTYWLRVPPIHRRDPVSMGYVAHAFRDVLPGEAVPPFGPEKVKALQQVDPRAAEQQTVDFWKAFLAPAARYEVPDPVLNDIYLSRLATRAILEVHLTKDLSYNFCSPFFYFDQSYRDGCYVAVSWDMAGMHDHAKDLLRVYCKDVKDVPKGPIWFMGTPIQLGMRENGQWETRPGQWDTQGQNLWALVQHYKLSGDREWLEKTAYPYIKRGAMWIVNSRRKHKDEVKDLKDPRYGLIEPGAMEVTDMGKGVHMYYLNAFAVLGLSEAADAAKAVGAEEDARLFAAEWLDLKDSLYRSFKQTFKRIGLYEGHLWFGVEPQGVGMYGFWAHNCLIWPCRCIDPHDPMMTATTRKLEWLADNYGGGMNSDGPKPGSYWPYIGVDRAIGHLVRGERERALDYFCAYTDMAGGTYSWGEAYDNLIACGDQPHNWADAYWLILFRDLFAFEDDRTLWITPALLRRWHEPGQHVRASRLPTYFGDLELKIEPRADGKSIDYTIAVTPKGDQAARPLDKIVLYPRIPGGKPISKVTLDGKDLAAFTRDTVILAAPERGKEMNISVQAEAW
jgi:hypothetical protein